MVCPLPGPRVPSLRAAADEPGPVGGFVCATSTSSWTRSAVLLAVATLASCAAADGPARCVAAGGRCVIGPPSNCAGGTVGPQDCNPDRNPGGAICCLPCPSGQVPVDGGSGCVVNDGPQQCAAAGGSCVIGPPSNCVGTVGPQDCNPDRNPGGAVCCLPSVMCGAGETCVQASSGNACRIGCAPDAGNACPMGQTCTTWEVCCSGTGCTAALARVCCSPSGC
jgi:hypothetical protein